MAADDRQIFNLQISTTQPQIVRFPSNLVQSLVTRLHTTNIHGQWVNESKMVKATASRNVSAVKTL